MLCCAVIYYTILCSTLRGDWLGLELELALAMDLERAMDLGIGKWDPRWMISLISSISS